MPREGLYKWRYYSRNALRSLVPAEFWRQRRQQLMNDFWQRSPQERASIEARVRYYNALNSGAVLAADAQPIGAFCLGDKSRAYGYDFRNLIQHFPAEQRVAYRFGDITHVPEAPAFVKSRPILSPRHNANAILLKLNSVRHYRFIRDPQAFAAKLPMAVWRGKSNRQQRIDFANLYRHHPLCDVGCVLHKESQSQPYHKPFMSLAQQLRYKYVVSIEGIDVATNLKWIMASNSLCLMRRPRYETWFMEGELKAGHHYVELAEDYSDLIEKISYYNHNPAAAEAIIANAQQHVAQFLDLRREEIIAILVMEKYLAMTGQARPLAPGLSALHTTNPQ